MILTDKRPVKYRDDEEDESCSESSRPASDASGPGGPIKTRTLLPRPRKTISETATPASPAKGRAESTTRRTLRARQRIQTRPTHRLPRVPRKRQRHERSLPPGVQKSVEAYHQEKDEYDRLSASDASAPKADEG